MDPDTLRALPLTSRDTATLLAGLDSYLREYARHRAEDGGITHPEAEWQDVRREIADLSARLEALFRTRE